MQTRTAIALMVVLEAAMIVGLWLAGASRITREFQDIKAPANDKDHERGK